MTKKEKEIVEDFMKSVTKKSTKKLVPEGHVFFNYVKVTDVLEYWNETVKKLKQEEAKCQ